jgi:DNA polymerase-4
MAVARKRCPEAIVVPPRFDRYKAISARIMAVFADFSPVVEPLSLDEAFLDMTGSSQLFGEPEAIGRRLKSAVYDATGGLTVTVGIAGNKYVAKVASGFRKPDGLTVVAPDGAQAWLAPQPVAVLWGAGPKMQQKLAALGLHTVGDLVARGEEALVRALGSTGRHFYALATAHDDRVVIASRQPRSLSSERTLREDIAVGDELRAHLRNAADDVGRRLRRRALAARGIRVKLKTSGFKTLTRQRHLAEATSASETIYRNAESLLGHFRSAGPFRLVGVAAYDLEPAASEAQLDLLDAGSQRGERLDRVLDEVMERFGPGTVRRARDLERNTVLDDAVDLDFLDEDG